MTSKLPNSERVGGKMRGHKAIAAVGSLRGLLFSGFVLLAGIASTAANQALAQDAAASCAPVVGRVVSLQGNVEIQRTGSANWLKVSRLDTSICAGDRLRTAALSRAALFVQPETLVRIDENTTISVNQTTAEVLVEFHMEEIAKAAQNAQSCGAGYFITRFPRKFKVSTPHMNAAVEGTEFMVESSCKASKLTVIEGQVLSQSATTHETRSLTAGQRLESGPAAGSAFGTVVKPADAVQWVLRFPPLSDAGGEGGIQTVGRSEAMLRLGSVGEALREIDAALDANPANSDALSLRAIVQIAKSDKAAAMASAQAAVAADPGNYRAWLALSYSQQAAFQLEHALESARKAQSLHSGSSLIHSRVAELLLSLGDLRAAEEAARAAVASNPNESSAHTMLGFVRLAEIDTTEARRDFASAIERDSFNALPRLGLGLAMIRDGELTSGREQIEIAVALDPTNSLLRSYVGKAYYEENSNERNSLAAQQFDLAKQLDPMDPTPHFYDAILKYSQSRPTEALADLRASSNLNDDRAVYRSRQLLDLDLAARNASQAAIYNELGLHQLGLTAAAQSLAIDPGSGSAHRFLADIYGTTPRHEISRASELLQAQLRQPLGAPPLQTQLANDVLFKNAFFGPSLVGFNEFNPLFVREDLQFQIFGLVGDSDSYGDQVIVNGLYGPVSFSLSQLATETDGYRPNNDDSVRQYDGFIQMQLGAQTSAQFEIATTDREFGDLASRFDPDAFIAVQRNEVDVENYRIGLRQVIDESSDLLFSAILQDRMSRLDEPDPFFPLTLLDEEDVWKVEAQYLKAGPSINFLLGASYFTGHTTFEFISPFFEFAEESEPRHINAYTYVQFAMRPGLPVVQLGLSYDDYTAANGEQSELNPKLGVQWSPFENFTVRAAAFRVLKRAIGSDQGLEPTQLAGFNQFFDDSDGTISEGGGLAGDFRISDRLSAGVQITRRNLSAPFFFLDEVIFASQREDMASGYVYWLPTDHLSVAFEPRYHDFELGDSFDQMRLTELPVSLRYFSPSGWRLGLTATAIEQDGEFDNPFGGVFPGSDSFWLLDAIVAYRFPGRVGTISLEGTNLLDEEFQFQETDLSLLPRYIPEAQVRLRFSLSF